MTAVPLLFFIVVLTWAMTQSNKRWMTLLWMVVGLIGTVMILWLVSLFLPYGSAILGHTAASLSFFISGIVGIIHTRGNRKVGLRTQI
jgi:O-antigen/teichoic acid export membrane protein